jgi:hypothetical protein
VQPPPSIGASPQTMRASNSSASTRQFTRDGPLDQFQARIAKFEASVELYGSDADLDLLDWVDNLLAEYIGGHITASEFLNALREDQEAQGRELATTSRLAT